MLTKLNLFYEDILKRLDKSEFIPVEFVDGTEAIGVDYKGYFQPWLMRSD